MSNELEQRLQDALDAGTVSDELLKEVTGQPDLESMIEFDAALRAMPSSEFDFSDAVLARLDEPLDEIPGLFDAPVFETDLGAPSASSAEPAEEKKAPTSPISLNDARRKRSAAPFLLAAAAVIGLVATGTMMTLNSPGQDMLAMESSASRAEPSAVSASPAAPIGALSESPDEAMERPVLQGVQAEAAEMEEAAPTAAAEPETLALADEFDDQLMMESATTSSRGTAHAPRRARVVRGGSHSGTRMAPASDGADAVQELSASQRRTVARIESCLPDHIRITRVRESSDGRRVVGVETSEPLSDPVDACVSGVLDSFPQARRRARTRNSMSAAMTTAAPTATSTDD